MLTSTLAFATDLLFIWRNLRPLCKFNRETTHTKVSREWYFMIHCSLRGKKIFSFGRNSKTRRRKLSVFHSSTNKIIYYLVSCLFAVDGEGIKGRVPGETVSKPVVIIKSCFYEQINVQLIAPSYLPSKQWARNLLFRSLRRNLERSWSQEVEAFSLLAMINYMEEIYS